MRLSERNTKITHESLVGMIAPADSVDAASAFDGPQVGEATPSASPTTSDVEGA